MALILASASPRRNEILTLAGYSFDVLPADIKEQFPHGAPADIAARELSRQKAAALKSKVALTDIILAADTVVAVDGAVLGKPYDAEDAARMLRLLSGKTHTVYTGVTLLRGDECISFTQATQVTFYELTDRQINGYIATGEPFDKAGAYGIQGRGCVLVKSIDGDYFNVMGLPIAQVARQINKLWKGELFGGQKS